MEARIRVGRRRRRLPGLGAREPRRRLRRAARAGRRARGPGEGTARRADVLPPAGCSEVRGSQGGAQRERER